MADTDTFPELAFYKGSRLAMLQGLAIRSHELKENWIAFNSQIAADWLAFQYAVVNAPFEDNTDTESIDEFLNRVWMDIEQVLLQSGDSRLSEIDSSRLLQSVRDIFSRNLDPHAWAYFTELVAPVSTYSGASVSTESLTTHYGRELFGAASDDVLIAQKKYQAEKLYKEYYILRELSPQYSYTALYEADMLMFYSWLLANGKRIGDQTRVWATIIATVAHNYLAQVGHIPTDINKYHQDIRASLMRAVGPDDAESLSEYLPKVLF